MFADFNNADQLASLVEPATTVVVGPGLGDDQTSLAILKRFLNILTKSKTLLLTVQQLP